MTVALHELCRTELAVDAAPEICCEVIASAGRTLEKRSNGDRLVLFETSVGAEKIVTKELVRVQAPTRIDYEWVEGPLPVVQETIYIEPDGSGGSILRYEGRFAVSAPWPFRKLAARRVARSFARAVDEHLSDAKEIAERRASRSKLYPRQQGSGSEG